jgi:ABC-type bacteriocin/lantibiotic exporter with double-glycine peptidase domain
LRNLPAETIVIVVSHRPALLEHCTRFVAIEGGRVVSSGSYEDVRVGSFVGERPGA